jgi:CheY-like chemotaxis protein
VLIRLLLVDDDDAQLCAMSRAFTALLEDLTVVTAHGGAEAIERLEVQRFVADLSATAGENTSVISPKNVA